MFCKECGSNIPDDAKFCPYCRETLKKEEKSQIETPTLDNKLEDDFNVYLDWISETAVFQQYMRTKLYLQVEKLSSSPISGAKVQLSGPPEVDIVIKSRKIHPKKSTNTIVFPISAKKPGIFTLTATLTSDAGHQIALPIKIKVEPPNNLYTEEPPSKPAIQSPQYSSQSEDELIKCICYIFLIAILAIISIIFGS
jgi:hypothetical protein